MIRRKSKPEDEKLIYDESADAVERSSAILRLAVDGYEEMESLLAQLLHHKEYILRGEAITVLLGGWKIEKYFEDGVEILHFDPEHEVRESAAFALSQFVQRNEEGEKYRERAIKELIHSLIEDDDWGVQESCYKKLLELVDPKRHLNIGVREFDREADVDWELLRPYMSSDQNSA